MARIYSLTYLKELHRNKKAENGVLYYTDEKVFKGTDKGYLEDVTDIKLSTEETNNSLVIIEGDIEDNSIRITNLESNKADKCQALAWSIIF